MASTIRIAILANGTQAKREFKDVSKAAEKSRGRFKGLSKSLAGVGSGVAGVASAIGPLTTGILAAVKGVVVLGKAMSAGAATAAAYAPSVAGAFALIKGTALIAAPAIVKALEPITKQFIATDKETGALAKRIQDLTVRGLKPLAEQFVKVNLPTIGSAMERIGKSMNGVLVSTGKWVNSTAGQSLIRTISEGTAKAMERLAPKVSATVIAFGNLANRAGDKALTGLADVIGRILDKMTEWANSTSSDDIKKNLSDLAGFGQKVKDAFVFLKDVGKWMQDNQGKVKALSDVLGGLGIAFALFAGGPIFGAIIGALSILINHWDDVKTAFVNAKTWWDETWKALNGNANFAAFKKSIGDFINAVVPPLKSMWEQIQQTVMPKIQALKDTIMNDVLPALTSFIDAMKPIVSFLIEKLGPVVAQTWGAVVDIIKGAFKIISGIFNIIAGVLTGNWSKVWEGIKQVLRGAWDIIVAVVKTAWTRLKAAVDVGIAALKTVLGGLGGKIKGWLGDLGGLLRSAGRDVIQGLINGIKQMAGRAVDAAKGVVSDAVSGAKHLLGIASPSKVFMKIGMQVMQGFAIGITGGRKLVNAAVAKLTDVIGKRNEYAQQLTQALGGQKINDIVDAQNSPLGQGADVIARQLRLRLDAIKKFQSGLALLRKKGFGESVIQSIAGAGLDEGLAFIDQLRNANASVVSQIRALDGQINTAATRFGSVQAQPLFAPQVNAATRGVTPQVVLKLESGGTKLDDLLVELLRKKIRAAGGNVQAILGRG